MNQSDQSDFYRSVSEDTEYLNALYRDLNNPDTFEELEPDTLVDAYLLATRVTSLTDNSYKRLHQMHSFTLTCKRMFLSQSQAAVYALLYRHKVNRVRS